MHGVCHYNYYTHLHALTQNCTLFLHTIARATLHFRAFDYTLGFDNLLTLMIAHYGIPFPSLITYLSLHYRNDTSVTIAHDYTLMRVIQLVRKHMQPCATLLLTLPNCDALCNLICITVQLCAIMVTHPPTPMHTKLHSCTLRRGYPNRQ